MSYLDDINTKKSLASAQKSARDDLDALITQLKEVQLSSLMNGNKSSVILADSTDFGEKMEELGEKIMKAIDLFRNDTKNADKVADVADQCQKLIAYNVKASREQATEIKTTLKGLIKALESIQLEKFPKLPEFPKIPAPIVNVPANDFTPIKEAIESLKEEKGIDLDGYKAHDILNGEDKQYIGFVAPSGAWYIIENKIKENSLRYVFGTTDYTKSFKDAPMYQYSLLSEAVNAL